MKKQIEDISRREKELHDAQLKLDSDRQDFEFEKEALDDEKAYVQRRKERYDSSSLAKVEELEVELKDEKSKYGMLIEKYEALSKRLEETQVLLDTVKTEIESSNGGKKIVSMREIIAEMQEFRDKYERLAAVYEKYPDDASISALEEKAQRAEKLERENSALEQERNRYREEAVAARNASKELEVVRQEVEATNALNEHLLQELESHKTALESRTGDTCPSLSKVDTETEETDFVDDINRRVQRSSLESLRDIVSHVKNYAGSRNKDERLYYTDNDIRAFLAGMAVSRLIILQGMSGTGKSSLPRIFSEAISGFNRLIPVESSWRDRNELLGYYNDFNKKFNAKSFTIELYRSTKKRCKEVPTFIVLDEMNLARIEYYFSDFLAILQEPDHDKWLIELVPSDMRTLPMELPEEVKQKMRKDDPTVFAIWEKIERSRQGDLKSETSDEEKEMLTSYVDLENGVLSPIMPGETFGKFSFDGVRLYWENDASVDEIEKFCSLFKTRESRGKEQAEEKKKYSAIKSAIDQRQRTYSQPKYSKIVIWPAAIELESDTRNTFKEWVELNASNIAETYHADYVIIAVPVCGEDEQKIISYAKGNGANVMILPLTIQYIEAHKFEKAYDLYKAFTLRLKDDYLRT